MTLQEIGMEIKKLRAELGKTQKDLSQISGEYQSDLSALETKGDRISGYERIELILNSLGYELAVVKKKKRTYTVTQIEPSDIEEISALIDGVDEKAHEHNGWKDLKQKLLQAIILPAKVMNDVIDDNIREDEALLEELREHAASQAYGNQQTERA